MTVVSELELSGFDYTDPALRGARFHEAMRALRAEGWLAEGPFGYVVLDREVEYESITGIYGLGKLPVRFVA